MKTGPIIIHCSGFSVPGTERNNVELAARLRSMGYQHVTTSIGVFQGVTEPTIMVAAPSMDAVYSVANMAFVDYGQACILYRTIGQPGGILLDNVWNEYVQYGVWGQNDAADDYTLDPVSCKRYTFCKN
jgi:hypothetical protein